MFMNSPKHALFIPGFGKEIDEPALERITGVTNIEVIDPFTVREALEDPEKITRAAKDALIVVHSAGILALSETISPAALAAFNTPDLRSKGELFTGAVKKVRNQMKDLFDSGKRGATLEALRPRTSTDGFLHPIEMYTLLGQISEFDSNQSLLKFKLSKPDISIHRVFSKNDEIFPRSDEVIQESRRNGLVVIETEGGHDAIYIDPEVLRKGLEDIRI